MTTKFKMKTASFRYDLSGNIGDQIQSLASEQFLPAIDKRFDRDSLREVSEEEKFLMIMQGWFSHTPEKCFPPSASIVPVFFGFHISDWNNSIEHFLTPQSIEYFKQHEPIGCRDTRTMEMLKEKGVDTFHSKCLTLTFPKRETEPKNGKVFLVNTADIEIPEFIRKDSISLSHDVFPLWGEEIKYLMAKKIIELYRDNAKLIVTTKLHCALPCIAMGIPVVFFGNADDYRISLIKDLNIPIYPMPKKNVNKFKPQFTKFKFPFLGFLDKKNETNDMIEKIDPIINWNPPAVSFEEEKKKIISNLKIAINRVIDNNK